MSDTRTPRTAGLLLAVVSALALSACASTKNDDMDAPAAESAPADAPMDGTAPPPPPPPETPAPPPPADEPPPPPPADGTP